MPTFPSVRNKICGHGLLIQTTLGKSMMFFVRLKPSLRDGRQTVAKHYNNIIA